MVLTAVVTVVLPQDLEGEHVPVVVKETLESLIGASSLQLDLDIVFVLGQIRRVGLHVGEGARCGEWVFWHGLGRAAVFAIVRVKGPRERVTVRDAEHTPVHVQIRTHAQVFPLNETFAFMLGQLVALQKDALWDAGVLLFRLDNVDCVIVEVVIDGDIAHAIVLIWVFNYWLEEVCLEVQHLFNVKHRQTI